MIEGECSKSEFQSLFGYNTACASAVQRARLKNSRQCPCLVGIGLTKLAKVIESLQKVNFVQVMFDYCTANSQCNAQASPTGELG